MRTFTVASMSGLMKEAGFQEVICRAVYFKPSVGRVEGLITGLLRLYQQLRGYPAETPHLVYMGQKSEI